MKERRGKASAVSGNRKGRPPKLDPKVEVDVIDTQEGKGQKWV